MLDLSKNDISAEEADMLGRLIGFNTPLKTLKLSETSLDLAGLDNILNQASKSVTFHELDVSNCEINLISATNQDKICTLLAQNCSITKL